MLPDYVDHSAALEAIQALVANHPIGCFAAVDLHPHAAVGPPLASESHRSDMVHHFQPVSQEPGPHPADPLQEDGSGEFHTRRSIHRSHAGATQ